MTRTVGPRAGVGYSENPDSDLAGVEAATAAMTGAGIERADLVLLFATAKHDEARLLRAVRAIVGDSAKIVGGGAVGVITNDRLGFEGCQVGVAVLASDAIVVRTFVESGLDAGANSENDVGRRLGARIRGGLVRGAPPLELPTRSHPASPGSSALPDDDSSLFIMYESVKSSLAGGPLLNMATPFLEGVGAELGTWPPVIGLGLHGDPRWRPGAQYFDDRLETQSAVAVLLSGAVRMSTMTANALMPMSTYREVTAADGPAVLEIDGRPALEVIEELVGSDLRWQDYPLAITLGVNGGDKFGDFREEDYANYLCVAVDRERRALVMSDTYLRAGTQVQLMRRQTNFAELHQKARLLVERAGPRKPFFALYIDCAGRQSTYLGTNSEDAAEIQRAIGADIPLFGVYSGSEIARVGGVVQRLNHAGILAVFTEHG
jgi:hypothetical protein